APVPGRAGMGTPARSGMTAGGREPAGARLVDPIPPPEGTGAKRPPAGTGPTEVPPGAGWASAVDVRWKRERMRANRPGRPPRLVRGSDPVLTRGEYEEGGELICTGSAATGQELISSSTRELISSSL